VPHVPIVFGVETDDDDDDAVRSIGVGDFGALNENPPAERPLEDAAAAPIVTGGSPGKDASIVQVPTNRSRSSRAGSRPGGFMAVIGWMPLVVGNRYQGWLRAARVVANHFDPLTIAALGAWAMTWTARSRTVTADSSSRQLASARHMAAAMPQVGG